jgi:hypothetical protein
MTPCPVQIVICNNNNNNNMFTCSGRPSNMQCECEFY